MLDIQKPENNWQAREYSYDSQALAIFALRSSVVVATVLTIPDAVALIPSVATITAWILKVVACWITALIVWFVFAMGLMQLMRLIAIGVIIDDAGIKLWRYGKKIEWESVEAICLEPEYVFTALFSYDSLVYRLTIYRRLKKVPGILKRFLVPIYIPSYMFSADGFSQLNREILQRKYGKEIEGKAYLYYSSDSYEIARKTYRLVSIQRLLVSIIIAFGVTCFLSRKACVLYAYNEGLKEYRHHQFQQAQKSFAFSKGLDPTFAPAWHGLAGSQFNVGDFASAQKNWREALKWKPDYVEAKVSLAYLSLQQRDFEKAEELLDSALRIDPYNSAALLNKADLDLRLGKISKAVKFSRLVIAREQGRNYSNVFMAKCLLAHARLLEGDPKEALKTISQLPFSKSKLQGGENLTYRLLVGAKTYLAIGENKKALDMALMALKRSKNVDTLLLLAEVRSQRKEYDSARRILRRCRELMPQNPWIYQLAAEINYATNHIDLAYSNLIHAVNCRPKDSNSLTRASILLYKLNHKDVARDVTRLVLHMTPDYPIAPELKRLVESPKPLDDLFSR